jgi:hypothetical protein
LLLGEFLIRLFFPQQLLIVDSELWKPDSTYGWTHRPFTDKIVNSGDGLVHYRTDSMGFRIVKTDTAKRKFLVIGDSFMEALGVEGDSTIPERLKKWLRTKGRSISYDNTGVSGYGPGHYYVMARNLLRSRPYDFGLIFIFAGNDFLETRDTVFTPRQAGSKGPLRWPKSFSFRDIKNAVLYPINEFLERNSHLFVFAKNSMRSILMKVGLSGYNASAMDMFKKERVNDSSWVKVADICNRIDNDFKRHNSKAYFILLPEPVQIDQKELDFFVNAYKVDRSTLDLELPQKTFTPLMKERGLTMINPLVALREAQKKEPQIGQVDTHLNESGHRTLFGVLQKYFEDNGGI